MKTLRYLLIAAAVCLAITGCGKSQPEAPPPATAATAPKPALPELTLQSGTTLRGFQLHFISHDHDWKVTTDPIKTRISDSETREIPRAQLRSVRVKEIERDEKGSVKRLQVVYATDNGEINGSSFPLGVFAFQLYLSPEKTLSEYELKSLFVKEGGFHINGEVHDVDGQQCIRIPLTQIKSLTLPSGATGDGLRGKH